MPLSLAISTISSVLIGRFLSLTAVSAFFLAAAALWLVVLSREWLKLRHSGSGWNFGWRPLGTKALALAVLWIVVAVLSLVDIQKNHQLFMSTTIFDHSARVDWTESVLHSGIPPVNPFYWYKHSATMRNYYFWYVLCAAVARISHLRVREVLIASCVWAGFALAAIAGLYLKHFLAVGAQLRRQFLLCVSLLMVTGLDICVNIWNIFYLHKPLPGYLQSWSVDQIPSWFDSLLWVPHHVASMACCMFAFLLAWMGAREGRQARAVSVALVAAALASAFGLSIYVAFAFFLVMLAWGIWQLAVERNPRPVFLMAAGGAGAAVLLIPYLLELAHTSSGMSGGTPFVLGVREMIPADGLLASRLFQHLATGSPLAARNLANLILLAPGYVLELGFYLAVFLMYLVPAWRGRSPLTPAQRSLVFIVAVTIPLITFIRSQVLNVNDFSWRAALLLQFPLLLLASERIVAWNLADQNPGPEANRAVLSFNTPHWLRSVTSFALVIGVIGTICQVLVLRIYIPLAETQMRAANDPHAASLSRNAYISSIGYSQLDAAIPPGAIVQYNPSQLNPISWAVDLVGINHQSVISKDQPWCGAEIGGDPSGCMAMAAAIDALFKDSTAEEARAACRQFGIQYLVVRASDPVWNDKSGWAWTLPPVVPGEEFRALDCR